jgi:hypothetical protein
VYACAHTDVYSHIFTRVDDCMCAEVHRCMRTHVHIFCMCIYTYIIVREREKETLQCIPVHSLALHTAKLDDVTSH